MTPLASPTISAIVLAGGRSVRFGSDKLGALVGGRPLLEHAVLAVAGVARDVVVVGAAGPARLPIAPGARVRRTADSRPHAGPLAGLETGLALVRGRVALVVAGDMPTLVPGVMTLLLEAIEQSDGIEAAALLSRGRREPLPIAVKVPAATSAARAARESGESSLRAMLAGLRVRDIDEATWRRLDPGADSLRDVDLPGDLPR